MSQPSPAAFTALTTAALEYARAVEKDEPHALANAEKQLTAAATRYVMSSASAAAKDIASFIRRKK